MSPRTALHLLLQCYNLRPLLRTTADFNDVATSAHTFDDSICDAVAAVLQVTPSEHFQTRCYLPRKFGGLGLTRHHGMATEKSQLLSRLAFFDFLAIHHPAEYLLIGNHFNRTDIRLGQRENFIVDPHHIPYSCTYLVEHSTFRSTVFHKYSKFQTSKSSSNLNFKQFPIRLLCFLTLIYSALTIVFSPFKCF